MSRLEVAARSDPGRQREQNEDSFDYALAADDPSAGLFVVADGMGGYAAGEVASATAVQRIMGVFSALREGSLADRLRQAVQAGNLEVYRAAQEPARRGMGSTVVCAAIERGQFVSAHVGDSRIYRLRGMAIKRLTRDHSLVQVRVDSGLMTLEEAEAAGNRNIITRALGLQPDVEVDIGEHTVAPGDCFLLCTDGLTGLVKDQEMRDVLATSGPEDACRRFIDLANQRGGPDNITALIIAVPVADGVPIADRDASPTQEMPVPAAPTREIPKPTVIEPEDAAVVAAGESDPSPAPPAPAVAMVPTPNSASAAGAVDDEDEPLDGEPATVDGDDGRLPQAVATAVHRQDSGPLTQFITVPPPSPPAAPTPPAPPRAARQTGRRPRVAVFGMVVLLVLIVVALAYRSVFTASPASTPRAVPTATATVAPPPTPTTAIPTIVPLTPTP